MAGKRGPKPTPTKILKLRGSWRAKKREAEPQFPSDVPEAPSWLSAEARVEWSRQVDQLQAVGLVAKVDRAALAIYCEAWAEFVEAVQKLDADESKVIEFGQHGNVKRSPWLEIRDSAAARVLKLAQEFGFTPSARAALRTGGGKREEKPSGKSRFFRGAS